MNSETYKTLRASFVQLTPKAGDIVKAFYNRLLDENPSLVPLFENTDMAVQRRKLVESLSFVVQNAGQPESLKQVLYELGAKHVGYGAVTAHYPIVAKALLDSLRDGAESAWSREWEEAWKPAIALVCDTMLEGAVQHRAR